MNKTIVVMILAVILIPMVLIGVSDLDIKPAQATVGYSSVNITGTPYNFYYNAAAGGISWAEFANMNSSQSVSAGVYTGWGAEGVLNQWDIYSLLGLRFDLSTVPAGADVTGMVLHLGNSYTDGTAVFWLNDYVGITNPQINHAVPVVADKIYFQSSGLVAPARIWSSIPHGAGAAAPLDFTIYPSKIDDIMHPSPQSGNYTFLAMQSLDYRYAVDPGWHSWEYHYITAGGTIKLEVTYATPAAERTMTIPVNDPDFAGPILGTENITGVSWLTPRCAFTDDSAIGWRIEGNPGASFSYSLNSQGGDVIVTGNNTIKTNGYYYLSTTVPVTFENYIKLYVQDTHGNNKASTWGRVELAPNINQRNLTVSAVDTEYPQFDYDFNKYIIYKDGIGFLYWKTNLEAGDMGNYHIKIMAGGGEAATSWNATMTYLNNNYFQTVYAANEAQAHWRYLIFTPFVQATGFNNYDGLIINVSKDYTISQTGFWQGAIRRNSDNQTLTWTDSAYYYLNDVAQGISITLDSASVKVSDVVKATINVGQHSKVGERLRYLTIDVINNLGGVESTASGFVSVGTNTVTFNAPDYAANFQARFTFYDSTLVPDYQYIKDIPFKTSTTAAPGSVLPPGVPSGGGFAAWIGALFKSWGMDDTAGHWVAIIILLVMDAAIFGIYGKMPLVATAIAVLIFGLAIYIKWVDVWITALIAIGAGFVIYRIFKRNTGETKEV